MKELITTLKAQHRALEELSKKMNSAIADRDVARLESLTHQLKLALNAHLDLEEQQLYPVLVAAGKKDHGVEQTTKLFRENMVRIAEGLTGFFDRHGGGPVNVDAFAREWSSIAMVLGQRCEAEETALFPKYDRALKLNDRV